MTTASKNAVLETIASDYARGRFHDVISVAEGAKTAVMKNVDAAFMLAIAYINTGAPTKAESVLRTILKRNPDRTDVKGALCKLLIISGKTREADGVLAELEQEARARPFSALILADAYLQAGRTADANAALLRAAETVTDPRIDVRLAETSIRMGDTETGAFYARRAHARVGLNPSTLNVLGPAALLVGDEALLKECMTEIDRQEKATAASILDFWVGMLMAGDHLRAAAIATEKAAALAPSSERLRLLADLHLSARDVTAGEEAARRALDIDPLDAEALVMLARCKIFRGDIGGAKTDLLRAIDTDPAVASAYDYLTQIDAAAVTPPIKTQMESLRASDKLSDDAKPKLLLAIARTEEAAGEHSAAFDHYIEAKSIIARHANAGGRGYDPQMTELMLRTIKDRFASAPTPTPDAGSNVKPNMIFIVGMPRSGTSLAEQILASHPDVFGAGELPGMLNILNPFLKKELDRKGPATPIDSNLEGWARQYLEALPKEARAVKFCTDKHPLNFWSVGLIKRIFPESRIVHIHRTAADTCLSILRVRFFGDYTFANEIDSVAHYYTAYENMMAHWRAVFGDRLYDLSYVALIAEPEAQTRSLLQYCGLDWHDSCLNFHASKREVHTHSAAQVREPINKKSVDRSRKFGEKLKPLDDAIARYRSAYNT